MSFVIDSSKNTIATAPDTEAVPAQPAARQAKEPASKAKSNQIQDGQTYLDLGYGSMEDINSNFCTINDLDKNTQINEGELVCSGNVVDQAGVDEFVNHATTLRDLGGVAKKKGYSVAPAAWFSRGGGDPLQNIFLTSRKGQNTVVRQEDPQPGDYSEPKALTPTQLQEALKGDKDRSSNSHWDIFVVKPTITP